MTSPMLADLRSRLTFCPPLAAPMRALLLRRSLFLVLTLFGLLSIGLFSNRALGQAPELRSEPSLAEQQELSRVVLQHLRAGDTAKALKALEPAGEWPAKIALTEANPLGPACAGLHRALSQ